LGPAAHSYDGKNRAWNIASVSEYIERIRAGAPGPEVEYADENTRYNDFILTGMRTKWGVNLSELESRFGTEMKNFCLKNAQKYIDRGFLSPDNKILKLTRKGIFISDGIMSDLMRI
jgi:oxygen-independent coproporphyrinogen-3 oxidase